MGHDGREKRKARAYKGQGALHPKASDIPLIGHNFTAKVHSEKINKLTQSMESGKSLLELARMA